MLKCVWCLYLILLHLLIVVVLVKSDFIHRVNVKLTGASSSEISAYIRITSMFHQRMDNSIPDGAVIFIGDSIMQSLATAAVSESSVNFGIGSDTTLGVLARLKHYKSVSRSKAVVLAIGINDLEKRSNSDIVVNFQRILNSIPSSVNVIVSAILPIGLSRVTIKTNNRRISNLNGEVRNLVQRYSNSSFVDIGTRLTNENGYLRSDFHIGDGIHLNDQGYKIYISGLKDVLSIE